MRLCAKGRYAVMALIEIADSEVNVGKNKPVKLTNIADHNEISRSYLEQLFRQLRQSGLVKGTRGPGGGYILARASDQILISDIVRAVDEASYETGCGPLRDSDRAPQDVINDLWNELSDQFYQFLSNISLEDMRTRSVKWASAA